MELTDINLWHPAPKQRAKRLPRQCDKTKRVRSTVVHVLGQIAYKKGCLKTVIADLKSRENQELVRDAIEEIIDVHDRYRNFAAMTQEEAYTQNSF